MRSDGEIFDRIWCLSPASQETLEMALRLAFRARQAGLEGRAGSPDPRSIAASSTTLSAQLVADPG